MPNNGSEFAYLILPVQFGSLENTLKIGIIILFICFLLSVSKGGYHPSFTSLSGFDSITLAGLVDTASNYCGNAAESLVVIYRDFLASSKIVKSGTTMLLGCGLVGLVGYGRRQVRK